MTFIQVTGIITFNRQVVEFSLPGIPGSRNSTHFAEQNTRPKIPTKNFVQAMKIIFLTDGVFLLEKLCRIFTTWHTSQC